MNNMYAKKLIKRLKEEEKLHYLCKEREKDTMFIFPMGSENAAELIVKLYIAPNGDCRLRAYLAGGVSAAAHTAVVNRLNALNEKYRFITLSLDNDGDVRAAYDFILLEDNDVFEQVFVLLYLFSDICDECVRPILRTIWQANESLCEDKDKNIRFNVIIDEDENIEEI